MIDVWGPIVPEDERTELSEVSSLMVKYSIDYLEGEDFTARFQSVGGVVYEGFAIYELFKGYSGKVTTEIMGLCGSISTIAFLGGEERIVHPTSNFFVHEARGGVSEDLERINSRMAKIYANYSNQDEEWWREQMRKSVTFTAEQMLEMGLATKMEGELSAVALLDFHENPNKPKEPQMAMTKEEKAEFEALKAENQDLKTQVEAKVEADKAEIEAKIQEGVEAGIKAEKERESDILALMIDDRQKEFASELIASGKSVAEASLALNKHFKENKGEYAKLDKDAKIDTLVAQAPNPSQEQEVKQEKETNKQIYAQIRSLKSEGDFDGARKLYAKLEGDK